ncbi:MAG: WYL domain-containing protein [Bacteroidales bacterium]|nr:WYL domain-containing protein [Bacteroidales bacterium]
MDQPRIVRELQLLMALANNRYATNEEICDRFEFTPRTLYRYIDSFREAGFVVKKNEHGVYRLETATNKLTRHLSELLHFSEEEEVILNYAIDSIEPTTRTRELLKKKLYALYDYKAIAKVAFEKKDMKHIQLLIDAIGMRKQVILKNYRSSHSNTTSDRLVEPYAFTDTLDQIWCYEISSKTVKIFKIARIGDVETTLQSWKYEKKHKTGFVDIFRIHSTQRFPVQLKLSLRAANLLMEEYPLSTKYLTEIEGNRYLLQTDVCSFDGITRFILGLYDDIEILGSPDLKSFVQYKIKMLNR